MCDNTGKDHRRFQFSLITTTYKIGKTYQQIVTVLTKNNYTYTICEL